MESVMEFIMWVGLLAGGISGMINIFGIYRKDEQMKHVAGIWIMLFMAMAAVASIATPDMDRTCLIIACLGAGMIFGGTSMKPTLKIPVYLGISLLFIAFASYLVWSGTHDPFMVIEMPDGTEIELKIEPCNDPPPREFHI